MIKTLRGILKTVRSNFVLFSVLTAVVIIFYPSDRTSTIPENTVKITNMRKNSGGSGVILSSHQGHSEILTNRHVCGVIKNGGLVTSLDGRESMIVKYVTSTDHDLCLITVYVNLHAAAKIAESPPTANSYSLVSGHPALLPQTQTAGVFGAPTIIQIMTNIRACTEKEAQEDAFLCLFIGMPIVDSLPSIIITNTIRPGSSGSAVYNSRNELSGLVFAGSGDFGQGFMVPYEYIVNFLKVAKLLPPNIPVYERSYSELASASKLTKEFCAKNTRHPLCTGLSHDLIED